MQNTKLPIMKPCKARVRLMAFFFCVIVNFTQAQDITRYSPNRNYSEMTLLVANNVKTIIGNGNAKGRKLKRFMKIGDSITKNSYSFGQFVCIDDTAKGGNHKNWEYVRKLDSYGYLHDAIEFFNQDILPGPMALEEAYYSENGTDYHYACKSYNRDSKAALVGMSADWPLSDTPSPFAQEIADTNPAYAIIMYGANDAGGTSDDYTVFNRFANNIVNLVDSCISRGIVPVLTASCPNLNQFERTLAMSHITRCIAQGRQIPYVNFFRAAMPLPNNGLGSDGVHPEAYDYNKSSWLTAEALQYGYNMRNLITMQQMNNVYQVVANNRNFIDDPTPAISGAGTSSNPYIIQSLSFVDFKATTSANPSYYYKLTLNSALKFKGVICYRGSAKFNIELLNSSMAPIGSNVGLIEQNLTAGIYYIKLSTVSANYGEFQFVALNADDSGMPVNDNNAPVIVNVKNAERCGHGLLTLEAAASKGTVNWYANATGGAALGSGNTFTTSDISSSAVYYVDATDGVLTSARTAVTATIKNNCTTAIHNLAVTVTINIHPNPTSGMVEISFNEEDDEKYTIEVFNNLGCKVWSEVKPAGIKKVNIDFSKFQSGLYMIKGASQKGNFINKIVKQ